MTLTFNPDYKYLYLVRHSNAQAHHLADSDFARTLTEKGLQRLEVLGNEIKQRGYPVQHVIASAAVRTQMTAQHLQQCLGLKQEQLELTRTLYNADVYTLFDHVQSFLPPNASTSINHLMLVGHNSGISEIAYMLCQSVPNAMSPCTGVIIELPVDSWAAVHPGLGVQLDLIEP